MSLANRRKSGAATFSQQSGSGIFVIEGVLNFDTILALLPQINGSIAALSNITIDLGGVAYSNSAGIALLLDVLRQCKQQQKILKLVNFPDDMISIIIMCGLEEIFTVQ